MNKLILGVDGGSTKSHIVVFDETGKCISALSYGILNHECMEGSYDELRQCLSDVITKALCQAGASVSDLTYSVLGLSGVDTQAQQSLVCEMLRDTGLRDFYVCNDAILGVAAGCPGCTGICAINGTGFKLAAVDKSGGIRESGGLGDYTGDKGGGTWYGTRACAEVYNALFKLGQPTKMRDMLFNLLGIDDKNDLMKEFTKIMYGDSPYFNSTELNSIVFTAAALGDSVASGILQESALQYGTAISRLAIDMDFPCDETLHVALVGSVFTKQKHPHLRDMIYKEVSRILGDREVSYIILDYPPVAGAVFLAAQRAGISLDNDDIKTAIRELFINQYDRP